jgi:hypothetical protein
VNNGRLAAGMYAVERREKRPGERGIRREE